MGRNRRCYLSALGRQRLRDELCDTLAELPDDLQEFKGFVWDQSVMTQEEVLVGLKTIQKGSRAVGTWEAKAQAWLDNCRRIRKSGELWLG